jgi:hypothetical protein
VQTEAATGREHVTNRGAHVLRRSGHPQVAPERGAEMVALLVKVGLMVARGKKARRPKQGQTVCWGSQGPEQGSEREAAMQAQRAGCCLTLPSRGGPTACRQARATERVRLLSVARAWRPTVGLHLVQTLGVTNAS